MKKDPLILTFDLGTQSTRALLCDKKGTIVAIKQIKLPPYISLHDEWFEQDPDLFVDNMFTACRYLSEKYPDLFENIIAVTLTCFRDSMVNLDVNNKPLRPCIMWSDLRTAKLETLPLTAKQNFLFSIVGMKDCTVELLKQSKSHWLIENEPEIWAKTEKYVLLSTYLIYKLCGQLTDSSSAQVGHISYDYKNNRWDKPGALKYGIFGIKESQCCHNLKDPGEVLGYISKDCAKATGLKEGLPIIATGADKSCETLGTIGLDKSLASISCGTTASVQIITDYYLEPELFLPCYRASIPNHWTPEVQLFRGFWMLSWFVKEFAHEETQEALKRGCPTEQILNEHLKDTLPGANGLVLQPFWAPALKIPEARGSVIGFNSSHNKYHLYRAMIEGIGYGLRAGLNQIARKQTIKELVVSGGGSNSDEICQILCDIFNLPIKKIQTSEACGLGSSIVGFVAMKEYASYEEACQNMIHYTKRFEPNPDNARLYDKLFKNVYRPMYKHMRPLFKYLRFNKKTN
jgi:sugar (pentulose or hexulose) kinase